MAIEKIEIKNFTVFNNVTIQPGRGVNVFIGENGTGKTHLLKILYAFCETETSLDDMHFVSRFSGMIRVCFQGKDLPSMARTVSHDDDSFQNNPVSILCVSDSVEYEVLCYASPDISFIEGLDKRKKRIPSVFIPAKDMLTHSKGLLIMAKKYSNEMPFDKTLLDIIEKATAWIVDEPPELATNILAALEKEMGGKVIQENNEFFIRKHTGEKIHFSCEAEGIKKLGLLWQLLMNESISKDTVLLWDEPEANINPKMLPLLVEVLLALAKQGVQIFIATHNYVFAKYFEVFSTDNDSIKFHSLYKTESGIACEEGSNFRDLKNNPIISAFDTLMDEVISKNLGD